MSENKPVQLGLCCLNTVLRAQTPFPVFASRKMIIRTVKEKGIATLKQKITQNLKIPTIGIGSSVNCDGQVLVTDDLIGLNLTTIKFVKSYQNIRKYIGAAVKKFTKEVKSKKYPTSKFSY